MASNPKTLTVVPFDVSNISPGAAELNNRLIHALEHSGSFRIRTLLTQPRTLSLTELDSLTTGDSPFILTGRFLREVERASAGKHIPGVAYLPRVEIEVAAEVRLYKSDEKKWVYLDNLKAVAARRAAPQAMEFDAADPSLALDAPDREILRDIAYEKLFGKMVKVLEKAMEIKK